MIDPRQNTDGRASETTSLLEGRSVAPKDQVRAWFRFIGCCISAASLGWHDSCTGPMIPYLQIYYGGVSDASISLIFVSSFVGYVTASLSNTFLTSTFGLGRLITMGALLQGCASISIASNPPYWIFLICYALAGFGLALQDAQFNTYVSSLENAATKLGIVHSIYGLSGMAAPIVATAMAKTDTNVLLFYLTNAGWSVFSIVTLIAGFGISGKGSTSSGGSDEDNVSPKPLQEVVRSRAVYISLIFITLYIGAEIGEAGWIVSYLLRERDGGIKSGYSTAVFFGGLTISRVLLLPVTAWLTEKTAVTVYITIAFVAQATIWQVKDLNIDFAAVGLYGLAMGPLYPITLSMVTKSTPKSYHTGAIGLMACLGQAGSALFPMIVGSFAEIFGVKILQPVLLLVLFSMLFIWQWIPVPSPALLDS